MGKLMNIKTDHQLKVNIKIYLFTLIYFIFI